MVAPTNLWDSAKPKEQPGKAPAKPVESPEAPVVPEPAPAPPEAPAARRRRDKGIPALSVESILPEEKPAEELVVRTYRVRVEHDEWLRHAADALRKQRRSGKADASEALRLLLDKAMGLAR